MSRIESPPSSRSSLRFAVTGAAGYVGSAIVQFLERDGAKVIQLRRDGGGASAQNSRAFSLQNVSPDILADIDVLIHAAYDFKAFTEAEIDAVNVAGSVRLFELARTSGVKRSIFISSISAFDGCKSLYGQAKMRVEKRALEFGAAIVRPGLVFGPRPGGMVASLDKLVSLPLLCPMVGNGSTLQYLAHQDDLSRLLVALAQSAGPMPTQPITAARETGKTLRDIMAILGAAKGKKPHFVPLPVGIMMLGLRTLETIGLRPRMRSDSLVSLMNQNPNPDFTQTRRIGVDFREFTVDTLTKP